MQDFLDKFATQMNNFYPFEQAPIIAVAISGGADSLSLLLLSYAWAKAQGGRVIALTVDHRLRPESINEAEYVASICNDLDIEHYILNWQHEYVSSNVQARAREARYNLLTAFCNENNIIHLLTAHHRDDLIENFFIRLSRGSGIIGLSKHNIHYNNNIRILRPLADFGKNDCYKILEHYRIKPIEDPSNKSDKYLRSQIRKALTYNNSKGTLDTDLLKKHTYSIIENLSLTAKTLEKGFLNCLAVSTNIYSVGYAEIHLNKFWGFAEEERVLVISHLLTIISGSSKVPRYDSVKELHSHLLIKENFKKTLHGCILKKDDGIVTIYREFGKILPTKIALEHNTIWDNRFICKLNNHLNSSDLYIDYITESDYKILKKDFIEAITLPKQIIFTLPAVKYIEKCLAIPHINYYTVEGKSLQLDKILSVQFKPSFISRLTHYVF